MQVSKKSTKESVLLVGFPSNGLVGTFTISYLVHHLQMKQIGEIDHPDLPPTLGFSEEF
ncbi:MAG: PAC2 family protein [Candidatus Bathyarchaeota archaeon]